MDRWGEGPRRDKRLTIAVTESELEEMHGVSARSGKTLSRLMREAMSLVMRAHTQSRVDDIDEHEEGGI